MQEDSLTGGKTIRFEENIKLRQPHSQRTRNVTLQSDTVCLVSQFGSELGPAQPQLVLLKLSILDSQSFVLHNNEIEFHQKCMGLPRDNFVAKT